MTEQVIRLVPIADLATVRVKCRKCQTVFEVAIGKLASTFSNQQCPKCAEQLSTDRDYNMFSQLEKAIGRLTENGKVDVEFAIPKSAV